MTQLAFVHHTERPVGHHSLTEINKPNPLFDASQYNEKGLLKSGMISISEFWTDTLTSLKAFSHSSVQLKAVVFFNKSHNGATLIEKFLIKRRRKPAKPKNVRSLLPCLDLIGVRRSLQLVPRMLTLSEQIWFLLSLMCKP